MKYLADTNIYRNLVRDKDMCYVKELAEKMRGVKGIKSGISIEVAFELISHLNQDDNSLDECFKALCLLYHSNKENLPEKMIFYPSFNLVLLNYFFNNSFNNKKLIRFEELTKSFVYELTKSFNIDNILNYPDDIKRIKNYLFSIKQQIREGLIDYLKNINNGNSDSNYFKNYKWKKGEKNKFKNIDILFSISEGMMIMAFKLNNTKYKRNDENELKLCNFIIQFLPAIKINTILIEPLLQGSKYLEKGNSEKLNTIIDSRIMFGLFNKFSDGNNVLVTEDKKMIKYMKNASMNDKVMNLNNFKKIMGIDQ